MSELECEQLVEDLVMLLVSQEQYSLAEAVDGTVLVDVGSVELFSLSVSTADQAQLCDSLQGYFVVEYRFSFVVVDLTTAKNLAMGAARDAEVRHVLGFVG